MQNRISRQRFLQMTSLGFIGIPFIGRAQQNPKPPALAADLVKEFVSKAHNDLGRVQELLQQQPSLLNAAWDWGGGDFETALEGAGHVGNKELANYFIGLGARTNLFVLTMLGKTALVKSYLDLYPQYLTARGPHGLTLLHHAQKGGEDAKELLDYLQAKGLKETKAAL